MLLKPLFHMLCCQKNSNFKSFIRKWLGFISAVISNMVLKTYSDINIFNKSILYTIHNQSFINWTKGWQSSAVVPPLWSLSEWIQTRAYHTVPCARGEQKRLGGQANTKYCLELQRLVSFAVPSHSWLSGSFRQITSV